MTIADLAVLVQENDKNLRALVRELAVKTDAKIEAEVGGLAATVSQHLERVEGQLEDFKAQTEDRFLSVEMKILGINNRIDILIDRTPSREEFGRLEGRVATLETRRRR